MNRTHAQFVEEAALRVSVFAEARERVLAGEEGAELSLRRVAHSLRDLATLRGADQAKRAAAAVIEADGSKQLKLLSGALLRMLQDANVDPPSERADVLIVEDEPIAAAVLGNLLDHLEVNVRLAETRAEARSLLEEHAIDLVVLDLTLPDGDGRDLLLEIRSATASAHIPVIVSTSNTGALTEAECLALGAAGYLRKPLEMAKARQLIEEHIGNGQVTSGGPLSEGSESSIPKPDGVTILLVEDDPISAALVEHRLRMEGWRIVHFLDGKEAFEAIQTQPFSLAIFDVKLPGMDGFELLDRARDLPIFKNVPVFILTGMGKDVDVVRGFKLGATDYMVKPFSPVELVARVRRLVEP